MIDHKLPKFQVLILVSTREMALSIQRLTMLLGKNLKVNAYAIIGGPNKSEDIKKVNEGMQIIIGLPGRVYDMLKNEYLKVDNLKLMVIDEADDLLTKGYKDQIKDMIKFLPTDLQFVLFMKIFTPDLLEITEQCKRDPIKIMVKDEELSLVFAKQYYIDVMKEEWKFETLCDLLDNIGNKHI